MKKYLAGGLASLFMTGLTFALMALSVLHPAPNVRVGASEQLTFESTLTK